MDDSDCLGIKILTNVDNHLKSDPEIDEYDILPIAKSMQNRNPVQLVEHKLGIESWGATLMYCSAAKDLKKWRQSGRKVSETEKDWLSSRTTCVLLMVPDHSTAWNIRKEMILKDLLTAAVELRFSRLVLTKHPKSSETFAHRRWLLGSSVMRSLIDSNPSGVCSDTLGPNSLRSTEETESRLQLCGDSCLTDYADGLSGSRISDSGRKMCSFYRGNRKREKVLHSNERHHLTEEELAICHSAADKYPSNYNAWSHRQWVVQHLACCCCQTLYRELETMDCFVWSHVSDHSGYHYRQFLLQLLSSYKEDMLTYLNNELHLIKDLTSSYPAHEAIWYHRRSILHSLMQHSSGLLTEEALMVVAAGVDEDSRGDDDRRHVPKRTRLDMVTRDSLFRSEDEWCKKFLEGCTSSSWLQTLVNHYRSWLNQIV